MHIPPPILGLPLPFYCCASCDHINVIGSTAELRERAVDPTLVDDLPELHRPWIDEIEITCERCGEAARRVTEVGDCWLDAGIVPFSTLNYLPEHRGIEGTIRSERGPEAERDKAGLAPPGSESTWESWSPADWITEMREQIRLWFYSQLFMSVTLYDRSPFKAVLTYEEMRDEDGEPFSKSGDNAIAVEDATARMGADVMRWQYAGAPLNMVFRFGYGPAEEVTRKMLRLWNVYAFFVTYANLPDCPPISASAPRIGPQRTRPLGALAASSVDPPLQRPDGPFRFGDGGPRNGTVHRRALHLVRPPEQAALLEERR